MTFPKGIAWTLPPGAELPPSAVLEPNHEDYVLLRHHGGSIVTKHDIIGFILASDREVLGLALTEADAANQQNHPMIIQDPAGVLHYGTQTWPSIQAWLKDPNREPDRKL
jgi:hypothetical protein